MILSKYRFFSEKILELFVYTYGITYVLLLVYDLNKDPYHMAHIIGQEWCHIDPDKNSKILGIQPTYKMVPLKCFLSVFSL